MTKEELQQQIETLTVRLKQARAHRERSERRAAAANTALAALKTEHASLSLARWVLEHRLADGEANERRATLAEEKLDIIKALLTTGTPQ